jgi:ribosomal protein L23
MAARQTVIKFPRAAVALYQRPAALTNKLVFQVPQSMTKPELRGYLEGVYGFEVERINTTVPPRRGLTNLARLRGRALGPAFKKATVTLTTPVEVPSPQPVPQPEAQQQQQQQQQQATQE